MKTPSHFKGAIYHVMLRGNYKKHVFFSDKNRYMFYELLESVVRQYHCKVHLFCLMTNHIHIVIEVEHIPLSKIMQSLVCLSPILKYTVKSPI